MSALTAAQLCTPDKAEREATGEGGREGMGEGGGEGRGEGERERDETEEEEQPERFLSSVKLLNNAPTN